MDALLKKILADNSICGFSGETVNDLVREMKVKVLELSSENQELKYQNKELKKQLEELRKRK